MASQGLIDTINGYENYILTNGIDENVIEAYIMAAETAINSEKDVEYGLTVTKRAKEVIEEYVKNQTDGTIWDLEKYSEENDVQYALIEQSYEIL